MSRVRSFSIGLLGYLGDLDGARRRAAATASLLAVLLSGAISPTVHAEEAPSGAPWPASYRHDANLFDVCFITSQLGWAVGDRGTILHTQDGGESWQLQSCPLRGRLEAVHFIDAHNGWAVGGSTVPYSHRSVGTVLRTSDGGQVWSVEPAQFLPWLTGVHFTDARHGVAWGIPSAMFSSAIFHTQDGGVHWTPCPGSSVGWVDGQLDAQGQGLLVDRKGQLVRVKRRELTPLGPLKHETRLPLRITTDGQGPWWLCGNQGLIQVSYDAGGSWLAPRGLPDSSVLSEYDWQAVKALGNRAWVVGVPGSGILRTEDGGQTWQLNETGHSLPLYSIDFVDPQVGWAVGALGSVLVTRDGGRSWICQRGERRHLSVLGVFGQAERIPWEAVAQLAAGEGCWTRIEVLAESAAIHAKVGQTPTSTRLHEAAVMLGGVGANVIQSLPAPDARLQLPAGLLRRHWDHVTRANSSSQLTEYLVRQIRTWQPDLVIVSEPAGPQDGLSHMTRQLVLQATEQAADAAQYSTQLQAGLTPWRVSRVTTISSDSNDSGYPINGAQLVRSLGQSVGHLADRARGNVSTESKLGSQRMTLRTLDGDMPAQRGLFGPTLASSDSVSRRDHDELADSVQRRNQQVQRRRNLDALLSATSTDQTAVWQQAMHLAEELPAEQRSELFLACAASHLRTGQSAVAFELLNQLQRLPEPLALREVARLRLFWYLASEEAMLHWPLSQALTAQQVTHAGTIQPEPGRVQAVSLAMPLEFSTEPSAVTTASIALDDQQIFQGRVRHAEQLAKLIQAEQPDLYFEPMLRFPLAALQRRSGQADAARQFWKSQLSGRTDPAYRSWAASELALLETGRLPARPCWDCPRLAEPPRLDGQLDDVAWQSVTATPLTLSPPFVDGDAPSTTRVRFAYDAEFLYLGVQASKIPTLSYTSRGAARQRDDVLTEDRVEIYLDVDRDAVTYWHLAIDHQGSASERLNDDVSWNPRWYIAAAEDESTWTLEAAIPLESLSQQPAVSGQSWCLGVQRIMPGHGWETWMQPAPVEARPEEFGLLQFR